MAKRRKKLKGTNQVIRNLNRELGKIQGKTMKGLIMASMLIRRDMEKTPPKIPVDTGNLRASWFVNSMFVRNHPLVTMGFSASYAADVHEKVGATFKRPGAGAKFFEAAIKRNRAAVLAEVARHVRIE